MNTMQTQMKFIDEEDYPIGFFHWLNDPQNLLIYYKFSQEAHRMAKRRERYSARTIVEVIRWNTDLQDSTTEFKINNNYTPGMARLWMRENGHTYPQFFKLRDSLGYDE
jgi:hypothetical protein